MAKHALIVDDSKSARLSLARILEKHAIGVDTAESAEEAIEHLRTHRPDAIFMDHNMPGMDGLQAVQAIKSNPRTATIPIMMYTSQEGAVYVGQARALGAIGVLPKQIKPADITKVLYQLNLAVDRRSNDSPGALRGIADVVAPEAESMTAQTANTGTFAYDGTASGTLLREQLVDLRRAVLSGFESQGDRLLADMRTVLEELRPAPDVPALQARRTWLPWVLTAALAGACVAFAILFWQQGQRLSALADDVAQLKTTPAWGSGPAFAAAAIPPAEGPADASEATSAATPPAPHVNLRPIIQTVPYGVEPFSGARLDGLRQLFDRLAAQGFQGTVDIRSYSGRFCLVGNPSDGYSLAPDDLLYSKCDVVSGTHDDATGGTLRIPVAMADLIGSVRASTHDMIHVQVSGAEGGGIAAYPTPTDTLTAGEWNRSASANNRIEIHLR